MTSRLLGWLLGGSLLLSLAGCEVGKCDEDAGCGIDFDDFGDGDGDAGELDGGHSDAGKKDGGGGDGDAGPHGDAGPDGGPLSGKPLTLIELCDELNSKRLAWANKLEECCAGSPQEHSAQATTILNLFGVDNGAAGCISSNQALIDSGNVVYHDAFGGDCAKDFLVNFADPPACPKLGFEAEALRGKIGHGAPALAQIASCRATLAGTVAAGGTCTRDFECKDRLSCRDAFGGGGGVTKTCQAPLTTGTCTKDADCAADYTCVGNNASGGAVCTQTLSLAGNCGRTVECVEDKVCDLGGTNQCINVTPGTLICAQP